MSTSNPNITPPESPSTAHVEESGDDDTDSSDPFPDEDISDDDEDHVADWLRRTRRHGIIPTPGGVWNNPRQTVSANSIQHEMHIKALNRFCKYLNVRVDRLAVRYFEHPRDEQYAIFNETCNIVYQLRKDVPYSQESADDLFRLYLATLRGVMTGRSQTRPFIPSTSQNALGLSFGPHHE